MIVKKNKGSALVVTLFILAIILISALSITFTAVKERKASIGDVSSARSYQYAELGIEKVMQAIARGNYKYVADMGGPGEIVDMVCDSVTKLIESNVSDMEVELLDESDVRIDCDDSNALVSEIAKIKSVGISSGTKRAMEAIVSNKSTKLLMHFNGEDPIVDSSHFYDGYDITNTGTVSFSDTGSILAGTKYGVFSGGKYLEIEANSETVDNWNLGDKDFTIEAWVKINNPSGSRRHTLISRCEDFDDNCNFYFNIARGGVISFSYYPSPTGALETLSYTNSTITNDSWHHLAFERKGSDGYFFIDGEKHNASSGSFNQDVIAFDSDETHELHVGINVNTSGSINNDFQFVGYMEELRITKGVARWTADFTPWDIEYAPND